MKKILFIAVTAFFFSCSNDSSSESSVNSLNNINMSNVYSRKAPCPPGTIASWSYDFDGISFHRPSTGCSSGFSICIKGSWVRDCILNPNAKLSNYDSTTEKTTVVGVLSNDNQNLTLHFPIEIKSLPTFSTEDFNTFVFESNYALDESTTIKAGKYVPYYTKDEIIITVELL